MFRLMSLRFVKFRGSFRAHGGVASTPARLIVASRRSTRRMGSSSRRRRSRSRSRLVDHHSQSPPEHINELEPWFAFGIGIEEASHEKGIFCFVECQQRDGEGRDKGVREKGSQCIVAASGSLPARLSHRMGAIIIIIIIIAEVFNYSRNETLVRDS